MKTQKVYIIGNGQQAPYGTGEIIGIMPLSHWRKILNYTSQWYNTPTLRLNSEDGEELECHYNRHTQLVDGLEIIREGL